MKETLAIASDHAGYEMKLSIIAYLEKKGYEVYDFGTDSTEAVDYPDFGHPEWPGTIMMPIFVPCRPGI